ncbi:hypothetical protein N665_0035s0026 [Sinapis alba]|nr:hypothetical protein N665_0035s0026 [Sinapis alba]
MANNMSQTFFMFIIVSLCALDIIGVVFESETIPNACCHDLVQEGKICHDVLIKYIADIPHLITKLKKRDDLWTHCVSVDSQTA